MRKFGWVSMLLILLLGSCLKDDSAERQAEHNSNLQKLMSEYGMTEADVLEEGLYRKIIDSTGSSIVVQGEDYIIADVLGTYADKNVFDASDADIAEAHNIFRPDLVYGPYRIKLDNTFYGFYMALLGCKQGDVVHIVLSHEAAFLDYQPLAYEIKIHTVIHDIDKYVEEQDSTYKAALGITATDTVPGTDSLLFWKKEKDGTEPIELELGDEVKLRLSGYYVETDPNYVETDSNYVSGYHSRQFFPINESGNTISGEAGVQSFPITNSLYAAIKYMKIGEIYDIFIPSDLAYGEDGFVHPYVGKYIIPKNMSLHFNVELLEHTKYSDR